MTESADRARLAAVEREIAGLRYRHDIAMSAFRFEEATALGRDIAVLEAEQQALAAALPKSASRQARTGVVPALTRPRRLRRARTD